MRHTYISNAFIGILLGGAACASAQWLNVPDKGIPRLPDGKPNLSAPAPRAPSGKPDLSESGKLRRPSLVKRGVSSGIRIKWILRSTSLLVKESGRFSSN
jgi:hypothetical protein